MAWLRRASATGPHLRCVPSISVVSLRDTAACARCQLLTARRWARSFRLASLDRSAASCAFPTLRALDGCEGSGNKHDENFEVGPFHWQQFKNHHVEAEWDVGSGLPGAAQICQTLLVFHHHQASEEAGSHLSRPLDSPLG